MSEVAISRALPVGTAGKSSAGWIGVLTLIATEAALFVFLLFSYVYTAVHLGRGFLPARAPDLKLALFNTIVLLLSSGSAHLAERAMRKGRRGRVLTLLAVTLTLGGLFLAVQKMEWASKTFALQTSLYGAYYFTITGFHMAHVVVGWLGWFLISVWTLQDRVDRTRSLPIAIAGIYWHFVDAVWLVVFFIFYIAPRLA